MYIATGRKRSLGQGNIFAPVCHSVHRGGYLGRYTPQAGTPQPQAGTPPGQVPLWQVHPSGRYTPPGRYPSGQVPPPLVGTPPGRSPSPWVGTPPQTGTAPLGQVPQPGQVQPPGNACWDTVNKWAVRILLECILVITCDHFH